MATDVPTADLTRTRGDTYRIVFRIKDDANVSVDISTWTDFLLTVDPAKDPVDATNNVGQITGVVIDGPNGRVAFSPSGTVADATPNKYYYDCQAVDDNGEKRTFIKGKYEVKQDITKD